MCTDNTATEPLCWWRKKKKKHHGKTLTLPSHGGSQRVHNFIERYGAPWEHTHPHSNMNTESRKQTLSESDSSSLLNIALGIGCMFNTNIWALILFTTADDSRTHLSLFSFFFFERPPLYARTQQCIFNMLISKAYKHMCKRTHCAQPTQALVFSSHCQSTHSKSLSPARSLSQEAGCKLRARNVSCH